MEQTRTGTRLATLAVAALALCLFGAAAGASKREPGEALLERRAAMLELLHHQAEIALVTAAQDRSFAAYFHATDDAERDHLRGHLERLTANMKATFAVDGVCLVGVDGSEIASTAVEELGESDGDDATEAAQEADAEAEFFRDAFLQPARHVYLSPIFVSPDSRRWVVSYATPIVVDGFVRAILHYEHSLEEFQTVLADSPDGVVGFLLIVDPDGWVIADSRKRIDMRQRGETAERADYFEKFDWQGIGLADLLVHLGRDGGAMHRVMQGPGGSYRIEQRVVRGWTLLLFEKV